MGTSFDHTKQFKRFATAYFEDDPITVEEILTGDFDNRNLHEHVIALIKRYNSRN